MRHGSLFSGIGGFDLAAEWMGWENVFHCEIGEFGQKVLKYYWSEAISYGDIKKTDFTIHRGGIDILTGGFPCQPYSTAGKRLGKEDDRHLWPEMLRAIREISPRWIVGENVRGLTNWNGGLVFDEVQADLETEGYEITPFLLPACAVNAPHRRDRIWFVAHTISNDARRFGYGETGCQTYSMQGKEKEREWIRPIIKRTGEKATSSYAGDSGLERPGLEPGQQTSEAEHRVKHICSEDVADSERIGQQRSRRTEHASDKKTDRTWKASWSDNDGGWPFESPLCSGNDGVPAKLDGITISKHRQESIKGAGNAIVPQVVYQIFKAIEQYETINKQGINTKSI